MSMKYIRERYKVPAKRGGKISFTDTDGVVWIGEILRAIDARLSVRWTMMIKGTRSTRAVTRSRGILHPTWNIEYL